MPFKEYRDGFEISLRDAAALVTENMSIQEKLRLWETVQWKGEGEAKQLTINQKDGAWKAICYLFCRNGKVDFSMSSKFDMDDDKFFENFGMVSKSMSNTMKVNTRSWRSGSRGRHLRKEGNYLNGTWHLAWH